MKSVSQVPIKNDNNSSCFAGLLVQKKSYFKLILLVQQQWPPTKKLLNFGNIVILRHCRTWLQQQHQFGTELYMTWETGSTHMMVSKGHGQILYDNITIAGTELSGIMSWVMVKIAPHPLYILDCSKSQIYVEWLLCDPQVINIVQAFHNNAVTNNTK